MNLNRPPDAAPGDSRHKHAAGVTFRTPHTYDDKAAWHCRTLRHPFKQKLRRAKQILDAVIQRSHRAQWWSGVKGGRHAEGRVANQGPSLRTVDKQLCCHSQFTLCVECGK